MFRPFGSELAEMRAESLRADGGRRRPQKPPRTSPGPLRRAVGRRFVAAGERLLDQCYTACETDVRIEMGGNR
jgi:hypothetical protein